MSFASRSRPCLTAYCYAPHRLTDIGQPYRQYVCQSHPLSAITHQLRDSVTQSASQDFTRTSKGQHSFAPSYDHGVKAKLCYDVRICTYPPSSKNGGASRAKRYHTARVGPAVLIFTPALPGPPRGNFSGVASAPPIGGLYIRPDSA